MEFDFSSAERQLVNAAVKQRIPINGSIELLPLCNMNCDMCYVRLTQKEVDQRGRIRSVEEWLDLAKQMKEAGVLFLLLTGGEPLLYPGFKELFRELKKMGMILTINTNGTLLNEEWADFFAEYKPRRINITLYGSCQATYERLCHYPQGFDRVINGIRLLKERGVSVKIGGSATKANGEEIKEIIEIGKELDTHVTIDTYMMPATRERNKPYEYQSRLTPEEAGKTRVMALKAEMGEDMFRQYRDRMLWEIDHIIPETEPMHMKCYAGQSSFTINWQGEMRPCVILSKPSMSVFEHSFIEAWNHIVEETSKILLNVKCSGCKLRPVCRTCAASALLEEGRYDAVSGYMCRYAEETERQLRLDQEQDQKR